MTRRQQTEGWHSEDLRHLQKDRPADAERLRAQARRLLKLGAEPAVVAEELHIRADTVHQMVSRLRRLGVQRYRGREEVLFCAAGCGWPAAERSRYCQLHARAECPTRAPG